MANHDSQVWKKKNNENNNNNKDDCDTTEVQLFVQRFKTFEF